MQAVVTARRADPVYVSCGHRVSLNTATTLVKNTSKCRIPEAINAADLISRNLVDKVKRCRSIHDIEDIRWCGKLFKKSLHRCVTRGSPVDFSISQVTTKRDAGLIKDFTQTSKTESPVSCAPPAKPDTHLSAETRSCPSIPHPFSYATIAGRKTN